MRTLYFLSAIASLTVLGCDALAAGVSEPAGGGIPAISEAVETPPGERVSDANPTFDCVRAEGKVETLICDDGNLARMDVELGRHYRLAMEGPHITRARAEELRRAQRDFVRDRNECWKGIDLRQCTMTAYARRIHEIRQSFANARDATGISLGPIAYRCEGLDAVVGATFVNSDPGAVYLEWLEFSMALDHVPSGSGAKYLGRWNDAEWTFWTRGDEATFSRPGESDLLCHKELAD